MLPAPIQPVLFAWLTSLPQKAARVRGARQRRKGGQRFEPQSQGLASQLRLPLFYNLKKIVIDQAEIALKAFFFWLADGRPEGCAEEHWLRAERELLDELRGISHEAVALRAWEIWRSEGCPEGRSQEHWLMAEQELMLEQAWKDHSPRPFRGALCQKPAM